MDFTRPSQGFRPGGYCLPWIIPLIFAGTCLLVLDLPQLGGTFAKVEQVAQKPHEIPLGSLYTTSSQKGMKKLVWGKAISPDGRKWQHVNDYSGDMEQLYLKMRPGIPEVWLVPGDNISEAVKSSRWVLVGGPAPKAATKPKMGQPVAAKKKFWALFYLGMSHSGPPAWLVDSVTVENQTVTLRYSTPEWKTNTCDLCHYFVWAPVGELTPGVYSVQLFDVTQGHLSVLRGFKVEN